MKKTSTFLLSLLLISTTSFAGPIDPEKANEIATDFWNSTLRKNTEGTLQLLPRSNMSKVGSRSGSGEQAPGFYVFTPDSEQGFVIVSGDDTLAPIVGYSATGKAGDMPPALCDLLNVYEMYVDDVRSGIVEPQLHTAASTGTDIAPLLTTTWNQSSPYNLMCPQVDGSPTPTGCTATAVAQIMKFHNWPAKPLKSFSWYNNTIEKDEYINTTSHKYDWDNMLDSYRNGYTTAEANAVALLMSDAGKAMHSNYAHAGTGSTPTYAAQALVNIFNYSPDIVVANRREYTNEEYMTLIRENLISRQPVMYAGYGQNFSSGHAFVCDGINENGLLHINWGWGGSFDGYFDIMTMAPGGAGIGGGEDRYNVGQAIIANIRPRATNEPDTNGAPTIWSLYVLNPDTDPEKNEQYEIIDECNRTFVDNAAKLRIAFALVNMSHSISKTQIALMFEKDGEEYGGILLNDSTELIELDLNEDSGGHYIIGITVNNNPDGDFYLEPGEYRLRFYYSDGKEENAFEPIRGTENDMTLEVTNTTARLQRSKPNFKVTGLAFHTTPSLKGDPISFDATFTNQNTTNSLALIAPVLNREISENVYKSDTLFNATAMVEVYDSQEILATFKTNSAFPDDGRYYITFVCNVLNNYTGNSMELDRSAIIGIGGRSQAIDISPLPDGVVLSATALSAPAIVYGEKANITGTVTNISTSDDSFTGSIAIFARDNATGKRYALATKYVEELAKDASVDISYKTPDYLPVMQPGSYTISLYQLKENGWNEMRQSAATCVQDIAYTTATIPYVNNTIGVNSGNNVVQGDSFEAKATINCLNGDFEGLARVNIVFGLSYHVRSEYVELSLKEGENTDITFQCVTKATTPLNRYRLDITYHDSNKKKLGDMSNNTLTYSSNGYFWIADATAIEKVEGTDGIGISAGAGCITVTGADEVLIAIYSAKGQPVYQGAAATVPVAKGLYIVTAQQPDGATTTAKVLVK